MDLRSRIADLMPQAREELAELVAIRSVADPRQFPPEECDRAAQWVLDQFAELGFTDAHLEETADGSDAVVGSRPCSRGDAPTVLLYAHYDVQPPLDDAAWRTPPFELTEVDGRWYGRGTADCKGNIVMHLAALRALGEDVPVNLKLVVEGSEEQGTGGLEAFVPEHADLLRADTILVCDTGNAAVGHPAATVSLRGMVNVVVTVEALASEVHSGMFGGPHRTPSRRSSRCWRPCATAGQHHVKGLDNTQTWEGEPYPPEQFRSGRRRPRRGRAARRRQRLGHAVGAPAVTVLGIDCPPVVGLGGGHRARRPRAAQPAHPAGLAPDDAEAALVEHLTPAPWGVQVTVEVEATGPVPGHDRRAGLPGDGRGDAGGLRHADGHARTGRLDPALQRLRRHLPRTRSSS